MNAFIKSLIQNALMDDAYDKDITSNAIIDNKLETSGSIITHTPGILSGTELLIETYKLINPKIQVNLCHEDGDFLNKGDVIAAIKGNMKDILKGERVALNLIERMSGVATITDKYVEELKGTNAVIEVTRDVTPGFKEYEFNAMEQLGAVVGQKSLSDHLIITRNHQMAAGSITEAVKLARKKHPSMMLEIEVENKDEYLEAIESSCNAVILVNMTTDTMKELLDIPHDGITMKAKGNMTIARVRSVASLGINSIIINTLSTSAKGLELSLRLYKRSFK